ncbi:hypothetical protein CALCODRAFT_506425 [Calocera cornea HHB12733]|uniref:Uncharacterized protein n=1 Tax=Calocera cornea HHB12733 TaxID=1353952 RepID=A0A165J0S7_9BASI|nr:hypothetical protein CALCODRAFT_506425 [Calocera cornea HHB12733]
MSFNESQDIFSPTDPFGDFDFSRPRPRVNGAKLRLPQLPGNFVTLPCSLHRWVNETCIEVKCSDGVVVKVTVPKGTVLIGPYLELIVLVYGPTQLELAYRPTEMGNSLDMSIVNTVICLMWAHSDIFFDSSQL